MMPRTVLSALIPLAIGLSALLASPTGNAQGKPIGHLPKINGYDEPGKSCPQGYACISNGNHSWGLDIPAGNSTWYVAAQSRGINPVSINWVRNRNNLTRRSVVITRSWDVCHALRYDDRFWVKLPSKIQVVPMRLTTISAPPGSRKAVPGCKSTIWI